ncbi:MAG: protein-glutamate O-methyltransferase CheR, partial [Bacteroidetes bacterium]
MKYDLTDNELLKVCELISANLGLHFPVERWAMLGRNLSLAAHEFGFQSTNGFIPWLLTSELNKNQINILASYLTVTETYFWREPQVFTALTDHILPELIRSKKKGDKSIRIWSAGCSTGEEAYSLAITLHKTIPKIKDWNISILATDINPKALEKARAGTYGPWSFRNTPDWIRTGYFHHHEDRKYEIIPEVKKIVTFSCHNLTGDDIFSDIENKMDIIFCRNVLMYFTPGWINRISKNLYHSLSEYGWLVVASSELSSQVFPQFTAVNFPGAVLYTKAKNRVEKSHFNISTPSIIQPLQPSSTLQPVHPITPSPHLPITPSPLLPVSQSTIIQPQ